MTHFKTLLDERQGEMETLKASLDDKSENVQRMNSETAVYKVRKLIYINFIQFFKKNYYRNNTRRTTSKDQKELAALKKQATTRLKQLQDLNPSQFQQFKMAEQNPETPKHQISGNNNDDGFGPPRELNKLHPQCNTRYSKN